MRGSVTTHRKNIKAQRKVINMNAKEDVTIDEIDCEKTFDDFYYNDADVIPKDNTEQKYYNVLELEYGADFPAIKRAYKRISSSTG